MIRSVLILLTVLAAASASMVYYMDLEDVVGMAGQVLLAEVGGATLLPMDYVNRMDYSLEVIEVIGGVEVQPGEYTAFYVYDLPRSYIGPDGIEVWESPLVTGSGMETMVQKGDTVIVLAYGLPCDQSVPMEVIRLEPLESLDSVLVLLQGLEP